MIPYKGAAPTDRLLGGHVEVAITLVRPGSPSTPGREKVRILLSSKKAPDYPQIPTLTQWGTNADMSSPWFGFFLPTGVPETVKKTLAQAMERSSGAGRVKAIRNLAPSRIQASASSES